MAEYPTITSVPWINPLSQVLRFKTLVSEFDGLGEEQSKQKYLFVKRDISLKYRLMTRTKARILWQFYLDRKGRHQAFNFFMQPAEVDTYVKEYVGTADGSTVVFNAPSRDAEDYTLYVDNVAKTPGGVDYTLALQAGTDSADKITFTAAPALGLYITWSFTGQLKIRSKFAEDNMNFDTFFTRLTSTGLGLKGQLNA